MIHLVQQLTGHTHNSGHYGGRQTVVICKDFYTSSGTMLDVVFCDSYNVLQLPHMGCDGPRYSSEVSNILLAVEKVSFKELLWLNTI